MGRRRQPKTAQEKILSVVAWATQAGFYNIATELREALSLLPSDKEDRQR